MLVPRLVARAVTPLAQGVEGARPGVRQLATSAGSRGAGGDDRFEKRRKYLRRLEYLNRPDPCEGGAADDDLEVYKVQADRLRHDSRVYVWGSADMGALGNPNLVEPPDPRSAPMAAMWRPILAKLGETHRLRAAAAGYGFSLFLTEDRERPVWGTGNNRSGQLGFFRQRGRDGREAGAPLELLLEAAHLQLPLRKGERVVGLAAGRAHSLVLTSAGQVLSLGDNAHGQCGRPVVEGEDAMARRPVHRMAAEGVAAVTAGQDHTLLLTTAGTVLSCGWAADGQTGQGHYRSSGELTTLGGDLTGEEVVKVACAADCVLALSRAGEVFGWGNSEYGQFAMVTDEQQLAIPTHLALGVGEKVVDVASGGTVCLLLTESGRVLVWGFGILGLGPRVTAAREPREVPGVLFGRNAFTPESRVTGVAAGLGHQAAVTSEGSLYTWGRNRGSCLGLGTRQAQDQPFPLQVALGGRVTGVSLGADHSLAVIKSWMSK